MKKGDYIIIIITILLAIALSITTTYGKQSDVNEFVIVQDGKIIEQYAFDKKFEKTITIYTGKEYNTIQIQNGIIKMVEASCPDQVCVKSWPISKNGEMIVCLPNKLYVKIISAEKNNDVDIVAN